MAAVALVDDLRCSRGRDLVVPYLGWMRIPREFVADRSYQTPLVLLLSAANAGGGTDRVRQDGGSQPAAIDAIGTNLGRRQESSTRVGGLRLGKRVVVGPAWSWCPASPLNGREREGDVDPSLCSGSDDAVHSTRG